MSYNTRYETSSSYNRDDNVRDRNTTHTTGNNTIRRSWDDTDRSNTNNNGDLYFSRTTTYRDSDRDTTSRPYTTGPFGTGSYNTNNTYTRDSDYNRGLNTDTTFGRVGYNTTSDRYATGTSDRYTGERGTPTSYDRSDRYTTTTGPRTTGYTGDVERFNVDRSNERGYTGYTGETRGYTGESRPYVAGSDVFNRRGCETCPDTYNYGRPTPTGHSATCDYNTRGGYGYTAATDYNRGYTDRDTTYGPRNYDRDTTTTRYTTDFRGGDNYNTGNRGFGGYTNTRSTF